MRKKGIIIFSFLLCTMYSLPCTIPKANADSIALGIYPPLIQIQAKAPTDVQSPMTISNESDTTLSVHIGVRPFTQNSSDNGQPAYLPQGQSIGQDPYIFQKMSIFDGTKNTDMIVLAPSQKKNIELRIHLPNGEPPGDYYFSITFVSNDIETSHDSGTAVSGGVSTNVLLSVGPKDTTTGYIKEFSTPAYVNAGPVPFTLHVTNTSKHFITPQGTILVKNMFGQIIGKIDLLPVNILANTSRYIPNALTQQLATSNQAAGHPVALWNEKFLLGPYAATLTIALSAEGPLYKQTIYFFALPIQVLMGIILGIILLIIIVYRVRMRLTR